MSIVLVGSTSGSCTLQEQAVAGNTVLTLTTTSGTILTTASSGQIIPKAALPTGSVLQVVSTYKSNVFSASIGAGSTADVTGFSVSITPTSASSKILIMTSFTMSSPIAAGAAILYRGSTAISVGDAAGSRRQASTPSVSVTGDTNRGVPVSINYLDSPATTSSVTYKIALLNTEPSSTYTLYFNTSGSDTDAAYISRSASSITVMEIAA